jgi:hypothetical protein
MAARFRIDSFQLQVWDARGFGWVEEGIYSEETIDEAFDRCKGTNPEQPVRIVGLVYLRSHDPGGGVTEEN